MSIQRFYTCQFIVSYRNQYLDERLVYANIHEIFESLRWYPTLSFSIMIKEKKCHTKINVEKKNTNKRRTAFNCQTK